jgi:hypothetical protein
MPWHFDYPWLMGTRGYEDMREYVASRVEALARDAKYHEQAIELHYGPVVHPKGNVTQAQLITVTDHNPFTIAAPERSRQGATIVLDIWNASGGTMGRVTFDTIYELAAGFEPPPAAGHGIYTFQRMA